MLICRTKLKSCCYALVTVILCCYTSIVSAAIYDNLDPEFSTVGTWTSSTNTAGFYGTDYVYSPTGVGSQTATWSVPIGADGQYTIDAQWTAHANRATNAPYEIYNNGTLIDTVLVNQEASGGVFNRLGEYTLQAGTLSVVLSDDANEYVIADAVQVDYLAPPPDNPLPTISNLSPNTTAAGGPDFTLTVTGTGFVANSVVRWNGSDRVTTYVNDTQLTAAIPAADITVVGTATVTVFNPLPGGGESNFLNFTIQAQNLPPEGLITNPVSDLTINLGDSINFTGSGTDPDNNTPLSYLWNFGVGAGIADSNLQNPTAQFDIEGVFTVTFTVKDALGLADPTPATVTVTVESPYAPQIIDNLDLGFTTVGTWTLSTNTAGYYGTNYVHAPAGVGNQTATWSVTIGGDGRYAIDAQWTTNPNRATNAPYAIYNNGTLIDTVLVNQELNGGVFNRLGEYDLLAGTLEVILSDNANEYVIADAVQVSYLGPIVNNPIPTLVSLVPDATTEGGTDFILTVNGTNFVNGSVVRWNGADRVTIYVSATQLTATILAADIATPGTATLTVFNPTPGGGVSNGLIFTIDPVADNPIPAISNLNPNTTTAGGVDFTLTITGTNFINNSVVRWNGAERATTYMSSTELTATILATDIAAVGSTTVTVFNPLPGGGESNGLVFTIDPVAGNPLPTISDLNPNTTTEDGPDFTLTVTVTVTGTGFVANSVVRWNGSDRVTTYVSATQLTATILAADIATPGTATITVFNPAPAGGESNSLPFTVTANAAPLANAGNDQSVSENTLVTLDGSASSDPDGTIAGFTWIQTAGPPVALSGGTTATPSFIAPSVAVETVLTFESTVTDNKGATSIDGVDIIVREFGLLTGTYIPPGEIGGNIEVDSILYAGATYIVTTDLLVGFDVTLTIEPGAILKFANGIWLKVYGTLKVAGTELTPVIFTSNDQNPIKGSWSGIYIFSNSTDSLIEYAEISYGDYGVGFRPGTTGTVRNSIIRNNSIGIIVMAGATPVINGGNVITANDYGLRVSGDTTDAANNSAPRVNNNRIYNNTNYNYYASYFGNPSTTVLDARNNWWGSTDIGIIYGKIYDNADDPARNPWVDIGTILNADGSPRATALHLPILIDTTLDGVYEMEGTIQVQAGVTLTVVAGTEIKAARSASLSVDGILNIAGTAASPVIFTSNNPSPWKGIWNGIYINSAEAGNLIEYAEISYANYGVYFNTGATGTVRNSTLSNNKRGVYFGTGATGTVDNSTLSNNDYGVYFYTSAAGTVDNSTLSNNDYGVYFYTGAAGTVRNSTLSNNTNGVYVRARATPVIGGGNKITANNVGVYVAGNSIAADNPAPVVNNNLIYGNTYDYFARYFGNASTTVLDAKNNWWGSTDIDAIYSNITDNSDYPGDAPWVDVSGYLLSETGPAFTGTILFGPILTDTILSSTYYVHGILDVPEGVTLTLTAGALVQAGSGAQISVDGTLNVAGTQAAPVIFTSSQPTPTKGSWNGIYINNTSTGTIIDHAYIEWASTAIEVNGAQVTVQDSTIKNYSTIGIYYHNNAGGTISGNNLDNLNYQGTGIHLNMASSPYVTGNTVTKNYYGLYIGRESNPLVTNNALIDNRYGIYLVGTGDDLTNPQPVINGNDIVGNTYGELYVTGYGVGSAITLDVTNNWWGTDTPLAGTHITGETTRVDFSLPATASFSGQFFVNLFISQPFFSPDGDANKDVTEARGTISEPANWLIEIKNQAGVTVRSFTGSSLIFAVFWDGKDTASQIVPDGVYTVSVTATAPGKTSIPVYASVTVDTIPPTDFSVLFLEPNYINYVDITLSISATGADEMIVSELADFSNATWGLYASSKALSLTATEGLKTIYVKIRDRAGNESTVNNTITLDFTPPDITVNPPDGTVLN